MLAVVDNCLRLPRVAVVFVSIVHRVSNRNLFYNPLQRKGLLCKKLFEFVRHALYANAGIKGRQHRRQGKRVELGWKEN